MHSYINTYLHKYIHTYIHRYPLTYMQTYLLTYIHTDMHTYIHTYLHTYIHTYILTYIHTYIPSYIHTYTLTYSCAANYTVCLILQLAVRTFTTGFKRVRQKNSLVFYTIQDENRLRARSPRVQHVVILSFLIVFSSFVFSQGLVARIYLKEQNFYQMGEGVGLH